MTGKINKERTAAHSARRNENRSVERETELRNRLKLVTVHRDELLAAIKVIETNAEECMDFDECTAMLVPIDDYHRLIEVAESVKAANHDQKQPA